MAAARPSPAHPPAVQDEPPHLTGGHLHHEDHSVHGAQPDQRLARQGARAARVHDRGHVTVHQPGRAQRQDQRHRRGRHGAPRHQAPPGDHGAHQHVADYYHRAARVDRVGVPGQQSRSGRRQILPPDGPRGKPAVHREQPGQHQHRVDRVGHGVLAVEQRGGYQRRHHSHAERPRPVQPQPPAGHVAQRHDQGADRRVDPEQHGVVHGDRVMGEPVHRRDQQRVAGRVERRVGEVGRGPSGQHPRRDQVRGLIRDGQRHHLRPAEPRAQPGLRQPAGRQRQPPPARPAAEAAVGGGRRGRAPARPRAPARAS